MRVAIYGRARKIKQFEVFYKAFTTSLENHNISFAAFSTYQSFLYSDYGISCESCDENSLLNGEFDALISLGGDGTILDTLELVKDSGLPVMGVNLGRLGFLANIQISEIESALKALISNNYALDKRAVLRIKSDIGTENIYPFALNDFVVQKRDTSAMITVETSLNDSFLNNYWADGLIVSTPTGSSGYSMSCGGPLVFPGSQSFVITPIAAHNLTVRPAVIPDNNTLKIKINSRAKNVLVTLDSRSYKIPSDTTLSILKADFTFNLIQLNGKEYMDTIRNKLLWGKDVRD